MRKRVIGVMGGAAATPEACELARHFGRLVAGAGHVLLCGGRPSGVMAAAARGAREAGGLTLGILPGDDPDQAGEHILLAVATGMGHARNVVNVLTSDVVVVCPGGAGTLSEVALALKNGTPVVALGFEPGSDFAPWRGRGLMRADGAEEALELALAALGD
jgi:uncharacterized protein (TIGR00725 family)